MTLAQGKTLHQLIRTPHRAAPDTAAMALGGLLHDHPDRAQKAMARRSEMVRAAHAAEQAVLAARVATLIANWKTPPIE